MDSVENGLTLVSPKLIEFPKLCAVCGEPTERTVKVGITLRSKWSGLRYFLLFLPIPFKEILFSVLEFGGGPRNTEIPFCETCNRPRTRAGFEMGGMILFVIAAILIPNFFPGLPLWVIATGITLAVFALIGTVLSGQRQEKMLP